MGCKGAKGRELKNGRVCEKIPTVNDNPTRQTPQNM
jgi:hypothetical protein